MRVLVTGGSGLLGRRVATHLLRAGHEPILFDLVNRPDALAQLKGVPAFQGDILDFPALVRTLRESRAESIVHTAALLTAFCIPNPYRAVQVNYQGTLNLLEAARLEGVRRVAFCSSETVYDHDRTPDRPVQEADPIEARTIYATTKIAAEFTGRNYRQYGVEFVACRLAALFGPGSSQTGVAGLWVDPLLRQLISEGAAEVERDSRAPMEHLYVDDAAQALAAAATLPGPLQPAYNVGEGCLRSFAEIIGIIQNLLPGTVIRQVPGPLMPNPYGDARQPMDHSLAARDLGYQVRYPMERALADYVDRVKSDLAGEAGQR